MLKTLTPYQRLVVAFLAFLQFTVVLDFMILSPLGALLMPDLQITPSQFGAVVSAYAFSAGLSGILAAGFADRYDRKKLLLFFYTGFVLGTVMCGLARSYSSLLTARIVTGLFGGVLSSISFAITTDLFTFEQRGRVMGVIQTAFSVSQVLGIPAGLYLSNHYGWNMPFLMIVGLSALVGIAMMVYMKPVRTHLSANPDQHPLHHLWKTLSTPRYIQGFATTALLTTGGFMMMPFASAFTVNNLGIANADLPLIYAVTGAFTIFVGPLVGQLSDVIGKFKVFAMGCALLGVMVLVYSNMGVSSLGVVMLVNVLMFMGVFTRIISSSALMSALPAARDRGAYMAVGSSIQQMSGGIASVIAGMIVEQDASGKLLHFDVVGYFTAGSIVITLFMMRAVDQYIRRRPATASST